MDDFEIELLSGESNISEQLQQPQNRVRIGMIEEGDVEVYIKRDVYDELEAYASSDTSHELGTILLGKFGEVHGRMCVVISNYIIARYTESSAATLTFTHKTWDYIHSEHTKYPNTRIVGWQHTHPGYGIFLSGYDMFIQENFFNMPYNIAYVIDPIQHTKGFFQWKNGNVEKLKGFYIHDDKDML